MVPAGFTNVSKHVSMEHFSLAKMFKYILIIYLEQQNVFSRQTFESEKFITTARKNIINLGHVYMEVSYPVDQVTHFTG
jgi:hypothetical protein